MIDEWTPEWRAENDIFGDIVCVNASFTGYSKGFGEKLYHWFQFVAENYPPGTIVGKTDDDFYGCANLYETIIENFHPRMYFGWWHPHSDIHKPSLQNRPDAQFVLIGWDVMMEVLEKPYCHHERDASFCTPSNNEVRYGSDFGGTSLGHWLGQVGNITGIRMNERMVHSEYPKEFRSPVKKPYCGEMISYHKSTPPLQRYLECFDQDIPETKRFCHKAENLTSFAGKKAYKPKPWHLPEQKNQVENKEEYPLKNYCGDKTVSYEREPENKKILIPLLPWGPNNQLQGFRESVYFAKALNRSLATPLFFPNWNQKNLPRTVKASMRLDVFSLAEIVSLVDPKVLSEVCKGTVGAVLKTRNNGDGSHVKPALDFYGLKIAKNAEQLTVDQKIYKEGQFTDGINKEKIRQLFSTDEKCAVLYFPWNTIDLEEISNQALASNSEREENYDEVFEIIKHTKRPVYVREAAAKFLKEMKTEEFLLMHWRYDSRDYFRNDLPKKKEAMSLIRKIKDSEEGTRNLAVELSKIMERRNLTAVYFASPPDEKPFLKKLADKMPGRREIESKMLEDFLGREFGNSQNCAEIMEYFGDLLSLVEMELSFLASTFVYSCYSTWR